MNSTIDDSGSGRDWTSDEVRETVADYCHMLRLELAGQRYNKAEHNRNLAIRLDGRSRSAIEKKHQNISAALMDLGVRPINGYKPLFNYQQALLKQVSEAVASDEALQRASLDSSEQLAEPVLPSSFETFIEPAPRFSLRVREPRAEWDTARIVRFDYLERESRNRSLGRAGEEMALQFEVHRLRSMGEKRLADRVECCSVTRGDGLGFDVLSFEPGGKERFIEVKTTSSSAFTPFFLSENERAFSDQFSDQFHLYRIFEFRARARMFMLAGSVSASCLLAPASYKACPR